MKNKRQQSQAGHGRRSVVAILFSNWARLFGVKQCTKFVDMYAQDENNALLVAAQHASRSMHGCCYCIYC